MPVIGDKHSGTDKLSPTLICYCEANYSAMFFENGLNADVTSLSSENIIKCTLKQPDV